MSKHLSRLTISCAFGALAPLVLVLSAHAVRPPLAYRIICNPANPIAAADRQFIEDAYLKRITVWPSGEAAHPVDLAPSSPVRRQFTAEVLRRPLEAVRSYWQRRIFAGRDLPPPEVGSDDEVIKYVRRDAGAIGYVSGDAPLGGVKALTVK